MGFCISESVLQTLHDGATNHGYISPCFLNNTIIPNYSTSDDMWDPCTGASRRPAFMHRRPRHTHQHLLLALGSPPPPPAAPLVPNRPPPPDAPLAPIRPPSICRASHAKLASISAAHASRAEPASAAIGCASLRQADFRPLHQTMSRRPDVVVSHALG